MRRIGYIGCVTYLAHSKLACQIFAYTCINRGVRLRGWGGGCVRAWISVGCDAMMCEILYTTYCIAV